MISHSDGMVLWHLDGENATSLDLSLFDNHNAGQDHNSTDLGQSKGMLLHLDLSSKTARIKCRLLAPTPYFADAMGSYDTDIVNGSQLVGWGQVAGTSEYGPDGDLRYHTVFETPNMVLSYRTYKQVWHATPADWDPSLVVEDGKAYVSWNGATDVEEWNVYTGMSTDALCLVGVAAKQGFETTFKTPKGDGTMVQVGAVQDGKEVRRSNVVSM